MVENRSVIPDFPRGDAVTSFWLINNHECLVAHLYILSIYSSPMCVLCKEGNSIMNQNHLPDCTIFNSVTCIIILGWQKVNGIPQSARALNTTILHSIHSCLFTNSSKGKYRNVEDVYKINILIPTEGQLNYLLIFPQFYKQLHLLLIWWNKKDVESSEQFISLAQVYGVMEV